MFNLQQIAGLAKLLFPNKAQMIDQAASMAQNFTPNKDGVAQLMAQYGKRREDIQNAVKMLDSPIAQKYLSKFPGLENTLRGVANEVQSVSPSCPENIQTTPPAASPKGNNLAARLARLK